MGGSRCSIQHAAALHDSPGRSNKTNISYTFGGPSDADPVLLDFGDASGIDHMWDGTPGCARLVQSNRGISQCM